MAETKYVVVVVPNDEDGCYYAYIPDLQGCMGDGVTPQDAVADAIEASHAWMEAQRERGATIPEPGEESERLDAQMREQADRIQQLENQLADANREIRALKQKVQRPMQIRYTPVNTSFRAAV